MSDGHCKDKLVDKQAIKHLAILIGIALVIGVYLIITTVLISKDGVFYIERAQQFTSDPVKIIKRHPPGYPFLILAAHKAISFFTHENSNQAWIYSAQIVTLLCRLLALIPLYFMGKILVGSKNSFWAVMILIFLPYPTKAACEVVREWPYLLFLATGFFFLLWAAKYRRWWAIGLVGLASGLGYLIRHESTQLIVYGICWLVLSMFRQKSYHFSKTKAFVAFLLLLTCFAIPVVPYMRCTERFFPPKVNYLINSFSSMEMESECTGHIAGMDGENCYTAGIALDIIIKSFYSILQSIGESFMWFFLLAMLIGICSQFRQKSEHKEILLFKLFVFANISLIALRYYFLLHHVNQRWTLPLVVFTVFYIPVGLQVIGSWLNKKCSLGKEITGFTKDMRLSWFSVLFVIGIVICIPKLFRPIRAEKQSYIETARWLQANTNPEDLIVGDGARIGFYAQRTINNTQSGTNVISGGRVTSGDWYNIVGTYDGKSQKLYINNKLVSLAEPGLGELNSIKRNLTIGRQNAQSNSYFKGMIDEVRLYNRALAQNEVEGLFNNNLHNIKASGMIGYWPLNGNVHGINGKFNEAMSFNGVTDFINLTRFGAKLNSGEFSFSLWVKPEILEQMNWIMGNKGQFCVGVRNSKAHFWIQEKAPGHIIPEQAAYLIVFEKDGVKSIYNKELQKKYSVWAEKTKKERIVVYEIIQ